jgi:hypothetical protein
MLKVLLAIFVGLFRRRPTPMDEPDQDGGPAESEAEAGAETQDGAERPARPAG